MFIWRSAHATFWSEDLIFLCLFFLSCQFYLTVNCLPRRYENNLTKMMDFFCIVQYSTVQYSRCRLRLNARFLSLFSLILKEVRNYCGGPYYAVGIIVFWRCSRFNTIKLYRCKTKGSLILTIELSTLYTGSIDFLLICKPTYRTVM